MISLADCSVVVFTANRTCLPFYQVAATICVLAFSTLKKKLKEKGDAGLG